MTSSMPWVDRTELRLQRALRRAGLVVCRSERIHEASRVSALIYAYRRVMARALELGWIAGADT